MVPQPTHRPPQEGHGGSRTPRAFPHLIDALHTAMMIYDEEGSKACQVFVDRQGLRTDADSRRWSRPRCRPSPPPVTRTGKFVRPEMTTLEPCGSCSGTDLPAAQGRGSPKIDPQKSLFDGSGRRRQGRRHGKRRTKRTLTTSDRPWPAYATSPSRSATGRRTTG